MTLFGKTLLEQRKIKGLNQDELAGFIGISRATLSDYERGKTEPDFSTLVQIAKFFGISVDEMLGNLSGEDAGGKKREKGNLIGNRSGNLTGQMMVQEAAVPDYQRIPKVVTVDREGRDNIAYVPIRAKAGYLAGYADPEFIQTLPTYNFPGLQNATFRMFEIEGHSMIPTFDDTDIIIGRFVESLSSIRNDRIHVLVTKTDGILVKRVLNRVVTDGKLILNSDNQKDPRDYPPIVITADEVIEVWYGVAKFTRQMRAPGEMYNRLIDLEARLTLIEERVKK